MARSRSESSRLPADIQARLDLLLEDIEARAEEGDTAAALDLCTRGWSILPGEAGQNFYGGVLAEHAIALLEEACEEVQDLWFDRLRETAETNDREAEEIDLAIARALLRAGREEEARRLLLEIIEAGQDDLLEEDEIELVG